MVTTTKLTKISGRVIFEEDEPATLSKPMWVTSVPPTLQRGDGLRAVDFRASRSQSRSQIRTRGPVWASS